MGGEGSGRKPDPVNLLRNQEVRTPIGNELFIPNYSGVQDAALKTAPPLSLGTGGGHVIKDEGIALTQRTNLNFSGSGVTAYDDAVNDATVISVSATGGAESDPIFMSLSGSLPYIPSSSTSLFALSGGATVSLGTHAADSTIHFVNPGFLTSGSQVDHTNLVNIGTNTHATIDTHIADGSIHFTSGSLWNQVISLSGAYALTSGSFITHAADTSDPHGGNITQTGLTVTTLSASGIVVTADKTVSGSAYVANAIFGTDATPPTASGFPEGTIYYQYTP